MIWYWYSIGMVLVQYWYGGVHVGRNDEEELPRA